MDGNTALTAAAKGYSITLDLIMTAMRDALKDWTEDTTEVSQSHVEVLVMCSRGVQTGVAGIPTNALLKTVEPGMMHV